MDPTKSATTYPFQSQDAQMLKDSTERPKARRDEGSESPLLKLPGGEIVIELSECLLMI